MAANNTLSTAEQRRIIQDMAPVMIWASDAGGLFNFFNPGWLRFTGSTAEEAQGYGWAKGVHPEDLQGLLDLYHRSFNNRQEFKSIFRLMRHDGHYRWVLCKGLPGFATGGTFAGYVGSFMDIEDVADATTLEKNQELNEELTGTNEKLFAINEELIRAEESLQQLNDKLEEKVTARTEALTKSESEAQQLSEELTASNEELTAVNEEMAALNEELATTNEELKESQEQLQQLNAYLSDSQSRLQKSVEAIQRSELLFKSMAQNIPGSVILVIDRDHRYLAVEGDLVSRMGDVAKDYIGKLASEAGNPEQYKTNRPMFERMLAGEKFSTERKSATGEDYLVHFVPLRDNDQNVYAGLIIALEITAIKNAQEKSAKLAAIIDSSDDAIVSKTIDSVITSWNDAAERIFGFTADEIIGETIYKIIPEDRYEEEPRIISRVTSGERVDHFETKRLTKDGRLIDVSVTVSPVKDLQGNIIGLSKIARDITEKKQAEQRKSDFIGMVSHELKTPLTSLGAILQVLQNKLGAISDPFVISAVGKANAQTKKMAGMINGYLNLSRLESGQLVLDKSRFDLPELVSEVISELELTVTTHRMRFVSCGTAMVDADRDKIGSVVSNLLSNAVKYSPKRTEIDISCQMNGGEIQIGVRDQGIGISAEDQDKLFDRYYRVESTLTKHISGFGIGLYLSAAIIQLHEGRIWVESEPGKGASFYFTLPLAGD